MRKKQTIDFALYLLVRLLICGVQALPLNTLKTLSDNLGWFCWHVLKLRRNVVEENLRIAFPEVSQSERDQHRPGDVEAPVLDDLRDCPGTSQTPSHQLEATFLDLPHAGNCPPSCIRPTDGDHLWPLGKF